MTISRIPVQLVCTFGIAAWLVAQGCEDHRVRPAFFGNGGSLEEQIDDELMPFGPSAEEMRIVRSFRKEQIPILERLEPTTPTDERIKLHEQLEALEQRLKRKLGSDRYEFYVTTQSVGYRQAFDIVRKNGLPAGTLVEFTQIRDQIRAKAALARGAEVWEVAAFARREVVKLFGTAGYREFKPNMVEVFGVPFTEQ